MRLNQTGTCSPFSTSNPPKGSEQSPPPKGGNLLTGVGSSPERGPRWFLCDSIQALVSLGDAAAFGCKPTLARSGAKNDGFQDRPRANGAGSAGPDYATLASAPPLELKWLG